MNGLYETIVSNLHNTHIRFLMENVEQMATAKTRVGLLKAIVSWHEHGIIDLPSEMLEKLKADAEGSEAVAKISRDVATKAIALLSPQKLAQESGGVSSDAFELSLEEKIMTELAKDRKLKIRVVDISTGRPYTNPCTGEPLELSEFGASGKEGKEMDLLLAVDDCKGKRVVVVNNPWKQKAHGHTMRRRIRKENPGLAARLMTERRVA